MKINFFKSGSALMKTCLSTSLFVLAFLLGSTSINAQSFIASDATQVKQSQMDFPASADFLNAVQAEYNAVVASAPTTDLAQADKAIRMEFLKSLVVNTQKNSGNIIQSFNVSLASTKQFSSRFANGDALANDVNEYYYNLFSN